VGRALPPVLLLALLLGPATLPTVGAAGLIETRLASFAGAPPTAGASLGPVRVLESFPFAGVALLEGPADALALVPGVAGLYPDEPLTPLLDRARVAVRADAPPGEEGAWPTGSNVTVALVDSGIDASHPGFAGRMAATVRLTRNGVVAPGGTDVDGHGTHVAGILAGNGAYSQDGRLHGLAPAARLVGVDISDAFTTTSAVRAFQWVHDHREEYGIRVVSDSWGREKSDAHYDPEDPVIRASDALVADGLVVVFSAGNRGRDGGSTLTTEGTNPNVITVGASTLAGRSESYSSKGPARDAAGALLSWTKPDLVAPGTAILSARTTARPAASASDEERYYTILNGTSMAAPQVAAAAALLLDQHPALSPLAVQAILQQTARDVEASGPDADSGFGLLDVRAAVEAARTLGGDEPRTVVVESRVPVHERGSVLAAQGLVLLDGGAVQLPPARDVSLPLALPPDAAEVELWLNWTGAASFAAQLDGPSASWAFEPAGPGSLHLRHAAAPGAYTVTARPTGAADETSYAVDGSVLVRQTRVLDARANEFTAARMHAGGAGGFYVPESQAARLLDLVVTRPQMVVGALLLLSCAVGALGVRRR
jgi:subtilisin family serine protease